MQWWLVMYLMENSLIFVDTQELPQSGSIVLLLKDDSGTPVLRRLVSEGGDIYYQSLNPVWPTPLLTSEKVKSIVGVVVATVQTWIR